MTIADIPVTKHLLPAMRRMEVIASMVSSALVEVSKKTAISVVSSLLNLS